MTINKKLADKVLARIDRDELAQLACDLTDIPSPTGQEGAIGDFILRWFDSNGLKAVRQDTDRFFARWQNCRHLKQSVAGQ